MYTDVTGRAGINEKNDCTVRALCVAASIPYEFAWLAMAACKRRKGSGACLDSYLPAYQANKLMLDSQKLAAGEAIPTDNVIVIVKGHIFAIRNGKHSDATEWMQHPINRKPVIVAWRIS